MRKKAFTIIELVMVMLIVAILAALAIPKFDSFYEIKLSGSARRLVSDIRYAQRTAIGKHETYGVEFDTTNERYRVYCVLTDLPAKDPLTRGTGTAQWSGGLIMDYTANSEYKDIAIDSASFGGTAKVLFTSFGVPQDGNASDLASAGTVTISYKGHTETVEVTPNTGKVTLQ